MSHDPFKSFIQQNKDAFDEDGPSDMLWGKLSDKLELQTQRKVTNYKLILSVAAAVIVVLASAVVYLFMQSPPHDQMASAVTDNKANQAMVELQEAEAFYQAEIDERKEEVFQLTASMPEVKRDVQVEFAQLDSVYNELRKELKGDVANEQVIEAMISNYRIRLELLEQMLYYLTKDKKSTNKKIKEPSYDL